MKWVSQALQPTSTDVCAAALPQFSTVLGTGGPGDRPWRNKQGCRGEEARFRNPSTGVLLLAWRLVSLTGSQQDFPEKMF